MTKLNDMRLRLLMQQEHERIVQSQPNDLDLSVVQARVLCWLTLLAEAHEDQANDAERRSDAEQAMGWYADTQRLRDVINLVSTIEIPYLEENSKTDQEDFDLNPGLILSDSTKDSSTKINDRPLDANQNIINNEDIQTDRNDILKKFELIAESLEEHCENIKELLKVHDRRLEEQDQIDAKLFDKIKNLELKNKIKNISYSNNDRISNVNVYKSYENRDKEYSQWAMNTSKVFKDRNR